MCRCVSIDLNQQGALPAEYMLRLSCVSPETPAQIQGQDARRYPAVGVGLASIPPADRRGMTAPTSESGMEPAGPRTVT